MERFQGIKESVSAEIQEKKSRFIADCMAVNGKEEAEEKIAEIKKKYADARHHCFAYRVIEEEHILERCSDDGEPSGTAGAPMLNILSKNELCNVLVVVTRYFGGILLGTGGLVRAYTDATLKAILQAEKIEKEAGLEVVLEIPYSDNSKFQYFCKQEKIKIDKVEYLDNVKYQIEIPKKKKELFSIKKYNLNFEILKYEIKGQKYIDVNIEM